MEKPQSVTKPLRKRKRQAKTSVSEPKNITVGNISKPVSPKKPDPSDDVPQITAELSPDINIKYPILNNEELIQRFLKVQMTNNQKGRIRQLLKAHLNGVSDFLLPDVIYNQMQTILRSPDLTDAELRKLRILYNMLKTALSTEKTPVKKTKVKVAKTGEQGDVKVKVKKDKVKKEKSDEKSEKPEKKEVPKVKGPKRYIVFIGNLPLDVTKESISGHFSEMSDYIKDVRIPKQQDGKKSKYAYLELVNEPSYEFALSKNHSMLGRKRITVSYTKQQTSKMTLTEAKAKAAKLSALQRSGKLLGSIPLNKKRSQRRKKLKEARAKEAASLNK